MMLTKTGNEKKALSTELRLAPYDANFLATVTGGDEIRDHAFSNRYSVVMHNLVKDGHKVGVTGFHPLPAGNYFQIAVHQDHRGKGLVREAADTLAKKYKLRSLLATIDEDNVASIKAHLKAGFSYPKSHEEETYRKLRPAGTIGLIKAYTNKAS